MGSRLTGSDRDCSRLMGPSGSWASDRPATVVEPGETEAGSVGTQPMLRYSPLAHRDDKRKRDGFVFTLLNNPHRIGRPRCLENPRPKGRMLTSGDRPFSISVWTNTKTSDDEERVRKRTRRRKSRPIYPDQPGWR